MTIRIYDFDDNAVKIEIPDKPIKRIDAIVLYIDKNRIEAAVKALRRRTERGEDR